MYTCMYACMHRDACVWKHTAYMHVCVHAHARMRGAVCTCLHACNMHACMCACMHSCMHAFDFCQFIISRAVPFMIIHRRGEQSVLRPRPSSWLLAVCCCCSLHAGFILCLYIYYMQRALSLGCPLLHSSSCREVCMCRGEMFLRCNIFMNFNEVY